ncbi:ROK family transcriptional regulator [Lentzea jiangxiensis]|uniref:Sugar kinase of the NBD/HSP70 family, may contain an N-terminal HTH domain n=1 Tax=Lentzea jiangxiensis TaxID=641025 RepID=A0A1H0JTM3_9PSEU|nr:ROK family protein [Lentzea jiangxiensis]SDO46883.1 Sugar kinase of the NBD/HSP70 family, may contain an N-terminal HTH domain [Lentzea jiangxiensis]
MSTAASVVLGTVLRCGPVARSTIARTSGLSPAAVTRSCAALTELGLLVEVPQAVPYQGVGRPHVPVDIDTSRHVVAGIHVAHPFSTLALADLRGRVLLRRTVPHADPDDPREVLTTAADELLRVHADRFPAHIPIGLGVAAGGWVDPRDGVIVRHASLGWRDVEVAALLTARTGLPVRVDSHARALARAEQLFGAANGRESLLHLFVGNVVDAAFVTAGAAHRGPRSAAGDVAHLALGDPDVQCRCGKRGCLEATVSDQAWAARAHRESVISRPYVFDLVDDAVAGSPAAGAHLVDRARAVGRAAAVLFDFLDPEVLVVTELGTNRLPGCAAALRDEVTAMSRASADAVLTSSFGEDVLAVAACAVQLDALYSDPLNIRNPVWQGV